MVPQQMHSPLGQNLEHDARARSVFERKLLPYLVKNGALSVADLGRGGEDGEGRIRFFELKLDANETADVVESARRQGLVEALYPKNAHGETIEPIEWGATTVGRELKRPRGLSFSDFLNYLAEDFPNVKALIGFAVTGAGLLLTVGVFANNHPAHPGRSAYEDISEYLIAAPLLGALLLALILMRGLKGEANLRRAARAWAPRLRDERPKFYRWQTSGLRPWLGLAVICLYTATLGLTQLSKQPEFPLIGVQVAQLLVGIGLALWLALAAWKGRVRDELDEFKARTGGTAGTDGTPPGEPPGEIPPQSVVESH
jgi:hypothetical protein